MFKLVYVLFCSFIFPSDGVGTVEHLTSDPEIIRQRYCLSIDGGGLRGVFPAAVLQSIESLSQKRICELFKAGITGTSTGALIALGLAARKSVKLEDKDDLDSDYYKPLFKAEELVDFYTEHAEHIFSSCTVDNCCLNICSMPKGCCPRAVELAWKLVTCCGCFACCRNCGGLCGPKYSSAYLRSKLEDKFGNRTLKDVLVPVQVVSLDISDNGGPIYFNSYDHPNIRMVDAALASAAAPTFFPPVVFEKRKGHYYRCVDGGVHENNPVFSALSFAVNSYTKDTGTKVELKPQDFKVVSIGTGTQPLVKNSSILERAGLIGWVAPIIELGIFGTSEAVDKNMKKILGAGRYRRIQPVIVDDYSAMDNPRVVEPLTEAANKDEVQSSVRALVEELGRDLLGEEEEELANADPKALEAAFRNMRNVVVNNFTDGARTE